MLAVAQQIEKKEKIAGNVILTILDNMLFCCQVCVIIGFGVNKDVLLPQSGPCPYYNTNTLYTTHIQNKYCQITATNLH